MPAVCPNLPLRDLNSRRGSLADVRFPKDILILAPAGGPPEFCEAGRLILAQSPHLSERPLTQSSPSFTLPMPA